jgi:hypothetical protein
LPESGRITTRKSSGPRSFATSSAAHTAVPEEPPARIPSSRVMRRATRNESLSLTLIQRSTIDRSSVSGHASLPIPSTRYGCGSPPEKIEPSGSAPTIWIAGFFSFR